MKRIITITVAAALLVGGSLAAKFASRNEATNLFKANLEALADEENESQNQQSWQICSKTIEIYTTTENDWSFDVSVNLWLFKGTYTYKKPTNYKKETLTILCCRAQGLEKKCAYEAC